MASMYSEVEYASLWLLRSKNVPLHLSIRLDSDQKAIEPHVKNLVVPHYEHCRSLELYTNDPLLWLPLPDSFPCLEELFIYIGTAAYLCPGATIDLGPPLTLRVLGVCNYYRPSRLPTIYSRFIVTDRLIISRLNSKTRNAILDHCHDVKSLVLHRMPHDVFPPALSFPELRSLDTNILHPSIIGATPSLKHLLLSGDSYDRNVTWTRNSIESLSRLEVLEINSRGITPGDIGHECLVHSEALKVIQVLHCENSGKFFESLLPSQADVSSALSPSCGGQELSLHAPRMPFPGLKLLIIDCAEESTELLAQERFSECAKRVLLARPNLVVCRWWWQGVNGHLKDLEALMLGRFILLISSVNIEMEELIKRYLR
ncbi:uncharacterized protein EI90DRAFT_2405946 [Cantharellus anzutake]|uniref:uncharacterized protein n=1 Tax=Cantharellus anzutake TaxID=1750568 RepID=UPI001902EBC1|nr:uncharacterized protein EI90DRAFT_2405946 [Cantharellus anzutake]KAF8338741.1 hypothetical protein EI90DRAFT_2405946 [Cantharellus anzutake]